jgi:hypothetical protein
MCMEQGHHSNTINLMPQIGLSLIGFFFEIAMDESRPYTSHAFLIGRAEELQDSQFQGAAVAGTSTYQTSSEFYPLAIMQALICDKKGLPSQRHTYSVSNFRVIVDHMVDNRQVLVPCL